MKKKLRLIGNNLTLCSDCGSQPELYFTNHESYSFGGSANPTSLKVSRYFRYICPECFKSSFAYFSVKQAKRSWTIVNKKSNNHYILKTELKWWKPVKSLNDLKEFIDTDYEIFIRESGVKE